ncbi:Na+/H+ antiporter subunit E [Lipingzhangella sp. LS1_29]|uniref:Na+/H+ antiporter subunit E n=1 Tax=Lipingzhangella rawalii TaxID=2055835 RepID=A0ABU2H3N5_9ACTN|nr:Na+/H+ antiporter subunit E [Lipingzhangella rawalii]MDS1269911.1 Na+/H+ antiporter subunit E [Lipingzhangella rawalii]
MSLVTWLGWVLRMLRFFTLHFPWKLTVACFDVAWDVLRPRNRFAQGIVEFRSRCRTDTELALMANLISLTPGTLTLAVRRDPATLYVHAMYCEDREAAVADLRDYEYRMLRAVRVDGAVPERAESTPSSGGDR